MDIYTKIGKLIKTHGLQGEISLRAEEVYKPDLLVTEKIFIEHHGQKIPYFIDAIKESKNFLIRLEDIENPEEANRLTNKNIYLHQDDVSIENDDSSKSKFGTLIQMDIFDTNEMLIGKIDDILSYPQQEMALVSKDGNEILIPIIEDFIVTVDIESKRVIMELPEGILDL